MPAMVKQEVNEENIEEYSKEEELGYWKEKGGWEEGEKEEPKAHDTIEDDTSKCLPSFRSLEYLYNF